MYFISYICTAFALFYTFGGQYVTINCKIGKVFLLYYRMESFKNFQSQKFHVQINKH